MLPCFGQTWWNRIHTDIHPSILSNTFVSSLDLLKMRPSMDICLVIQQEVKKTLKSAGSVGGIWINGS